jgi:hypothetical protein
MGEIGKQTPVSKPGHSFNAFIHTFALFHSHAIAIRTTTPMPVAANVLWFGTSAPSGQIY